MISIGGDGQDRDTEELRREVRQSAVLVGVVMLLVLFGMVIGFAV
jgi:hypothetical protein